MKIKTLVSLYIIVSISLTLEARQGRTLTDFPQLMMANIPGAPVLSGPVLLSGSNNEIVSRGHGLAAPAFYDWDGDGLKDLLVGEFGSGVENGRYVGNFIRVYRNIGSDDKPEFAGKFNYAYPPFQYRVKTNGTPYSVDQFCCIGFTPQFADLNNDGRTDLITGSYQGEVYWFKGTADGFMPGESLPQEGNPRDPDNLAFQKNQDYWLFSSASFGDLTGDGLSDLIVGGSSLRISKNIGTDDSPAFGKRELLLNVEGEPLKIYDYTPEELQQKQKLEDMSRGTIPVPVSGAEHVSPLVVDWDQDGTLDLLVTNSYLHRGLPAITFFKGVKRDGLYRFQKGVSLIEATNEHKPFPGSNLKVYVTDWNSDGINDLLIACSVATVNGQFSEQLAWNWESSMELYGAGKDPANMASLTKEQLESYQAEVKLPEQITMDEYMTIRHKGYVFVLMGSKAKTQASTTNKKTKSK